MHMCIDICQPFHRYVCSCVYLYRHMYVYMCLYVSTPMYIHVQMYIQIQVSIHSCIQYIYTYLHDRKCVLMLWFVAPRHKPMQSLLFLHDFSLSLSLHVWIYIQMHTAFCVFLFASSVCVCSGCKFILSKRIRNVFPDSVFPLSAGFP